MSELKDGGIIKAGDTRFKVQFPRPRLTPEMERKHVEHTGECEQCKWDRQMLKELYERDLAAKIKRQSQPPSTVSRDRDYEEDSVPVNEDEWIRQWEKKKPQ